MADFWLWDFDLGLPEATEDALPTIFFAQAVATAVAIWFYQWFQRRVMQPAIGDAAAESVTPGAASAAEVRGHAAALARLETRIGELEAGRNMRSPMGATYRQTTPIGSTDLVSSPSNLRYSH